MPEGDPSVPKSGTEPTQPTTRKKGGGGSAHDRAVAKTAGSTPTTRPAPENILRDNRHTLSDSLTIAAFLLAVLMWAFIPSIFGKVFAVLLSAGGAVYLAYKASWTSKFPKSRQHLWAVMLSTLILLGGGWRIHDQWNEEHPRNEALPGISLNLVLRLRNRLGNERQYIADFGLREGPRLSLYISPEKRLTFTLLDKNGEPHPLEASLGEDVPIDRFTMLTSEIGVKGQSTIMRIFVNGTRIKYMELPFRLDLGPLDIPGGVVGSDLLGQHGAQFDEVEMAVNSATLSDDELAQYLCYERHLPVKQLSYIRFSGNQWMRAQTTTFGHADFKQADGVHPPTFYTFTEEDGRDWLKGDC